VDRFFVHRLHRLDGLFLKDKRDKLQERNRVGYMFFVLIDFVLTRVELTQPKTIQHKLKIIITKNKFAVFKLFALEFSFTFACLDFGRQAWTLLNR
jgi:hypothetical protein